MGGGGGGGGGGAGKEDITAPKIHPAASLL